MKKSIEELIREHLVRLVGLGAAQFFDDAAGIATGKLETQASLNLLAHCLREIESAVRQSAGPYTPKPKNEKDTAAREIDEACKTLGISDEARLAWHALVSDKTSESKLHTLTHRYGFAQARGDGQTLQATWQKALMVLQNVLPRLETRFSKHLETLDSILSAKTPAVDRLVGEVPNSPVILAEFFGRVSDVEWLEPLAASGYFQHPPSAIRHDDGVQYPSWPQLLYLEKLVASQPAGVFDVLISLDTDNQHIHGVAAKIACAMPAEMLAKWTKQETAWVEQEERLHLLLGQHLGECVIELATQRRFPEEALGLARALLRLRYAEHRMHDVRSKHDYWLYTRLLRTMVPALCEAWPQQTFAMLLELLDEGLKFDRDSDGDANDGSYIWKPNVASDGSHGDVLGELVTCIHRAGVQSVGQGTAVDELLAALTNSPWHVSSRLALALANANHASAAAWASDALLGPRFFDEHRFRFEYVTLLRTAWPAWTDEQRALWLRRVDDGPSEEELKWIAPTADAPPTPEHVSEFKAQWRLRQLWPLRGLLGESAEKGVDDLAARYGEPDGWLFPFQLRTFEGPTSPVSEGDVASMTAVEVAGLCKDWVYKPGPDMPPSPLGLARCLPETIAARPDEFVAALAAFRGVAPVYASNLLLGLNQAANAKAELDWNAILDFAEWVIAQDGSVPKTDDMTDTDWGGARRELVRLIAAACRRREIIDEPNNSRALILILTVLEASDVANDGVKTWRDAFDASMNTNCGQAMRALILWLRAQQSGEQPSVGIDRFPKAKAALEKCLSAEHRRRATHAAIGEDMAFLAWLDRDWLRSQLNLLFPGDAPEIADAAWSSYIRYGGPPTRLSAEIFADRYRAAIASLSVEPMNDIRTENLIGHLAHFVWWEALEEREGLGAELLAAFWIHGTGPQAKELLETLGRTLANEKLKVSPAMLDCFKRLWESRVEAAKQSGDASALAAFAWWFRSKRFERDWSLAQLAEVFASAEPDWLDEEILQDLKSLAKAAPVGVAKCIEGLVVARAENLWFHRGALAEILEQCHASGEAEAVRLAVEIANRLTAKGLVEFRNLFKSED